MRDIRLKLYIKAVGLKDALLRDERGQDIIEYALVIAMIALAATAGMSTVASAIRTTLSKVGSKLNNYTS